MDVTRCREIIRRADSSSPAPWTSQVEGRDCFGGSDFIAVTVAGEPIDLDVRAAPRILDLLTTLREFLPWGATLLLQNETDSVTALSAPDLLGIEQVERSVVGYSGPWTRLEDVSYSRLVDLHGEVVLTFCDGPECDREFICNAMSDAEFLLQSFASHRQRGVGSCFPPQQILDVVAFGVVPPLIEFGEGAGVECFACFPGSRFHTTKSQREFTVGTLQRVFGIDAQFSCKIHH
jgi:hypothetical protein